MHCFLTDSSVPVRVFQELFVTGFYYWLRLPTHVPTNENKRRGWIKELTAANTMANMTTVMTCWPIDELLIHDSPVYSCIIIVKSWWHWILILVFTCWTMELKIEASSVWPSDPLSKHIILVSLKVLWRIKVKPKPRGSRSKKPRSKSNGHFNNAKSYK